MTSTVVGLQIAKATRLEMRAVDRIEVEAGAGIVGDRYHGSRHRQVSVQSLEELAAAAAAGRPCRGYIGGPARLDFLVP